MQRDVRDNMSESYHLCILLFTLPHDNAFGLETLRLEKHKLINLQHTVVTNFARIELLVGTDRTDVVLLFVLNISQR